MLAGSAWAQAQAQASFPPAQESSEWRLSAGVRLWSAQWDSWYINPFGVGPDGTRYEVVEAMSSSKAKLAAIPFLSLRYGQWFASASSLLRTSYPFDTTIPNTFAIDNSRREFDLNLGYAFSSGISVSLGNKEIRQGFDDAYAKTSGLVLGVSASAPLSSGWGLYGSFGKGWLKARFSFADVNGNTSFDTDYQLLEAGLTYAFQAPTRWIRSVVLTTGYRTQRMAAQGFGLAKTPPGGSRQPNGTAELIDVTQGFVLGAQATF